MMTTGPIYANLNVEFEDICFLRATAINEDQEIDLSIVIHHGSGRFEISESSTPVVTGVVRKMDQSNSSHESRFRCNRPASVTLNKEGFYKELRLRGYHYKGLFQCIEEASDDVSFAKIKWENSWTALMDCMLQLNILAKDTRLLYLPTRIRKVRINAVKHLALVKNDALLDASYCPELNIIKCGGVEVIDMVVSSVVRRKQPGLEVHDRYEFVPLNPDYEMNVTDVMKVVTQLILENSMATVLDVLEIHDDRIEPIIGLFADVIREIPIAKMKLTLRSDLELDIDNVEIKRKSTHAQDDTVKSVHLVTVQANCLQNLEENRTTWESIGEDCFLLSRESERTIDLSNVSDEFACVSTLYSESETFVLLRKQRPVSRNEQTVITVSSTDNSFEWISSLKRSVKAGPVILVAVNDKYSGLIGLINCLRREGHDVKGLVIDDINAPDFHTEHPLYSSQINLGIAINVYRNGTWGTYRFLTLANPTEASPQSGHIYGNVHRIGDLSSFRWYNGKFNVSPPKNPVNIHYSSINFRDVMLATGRLPQDAVTDTRLQECVLGFEYSGVNKNGERVMGWAENGGLATQVELVEDLTWTIPPDMSMKDAATIPVVYITVYYAFFLHNRISRGKSILIHAGSGGVGLAAIRVALAYGLEVFTTVSNEEKKAFILGLFPELKGNFGKISSGLVAQNDKEI